ncbi:hypothetical protein KEM52_005774 [Ascosphaera acerosa]|nr:hypothetical protein KEM52_005774 [Ascosphaera acerosa]
MAAVDAQTGKDPRVDDYLNDRIQTADDLGNLDDLLQALQEQHELQKRQLCEAEEALAQASKTSLDHSDRLRRVIEAFDVQQAEIDQRLATTMASHGVNEAVRKAQSLMDRVRTYEVAQGYLGTLAEVEELRLVTFQLAIGGVSTQMLTVRDRSTAMKHLEERPLQALPPFLRLQEIHASLQSAQHAAEGAAPHMVDSVQATTTMLRESLERQFEGDLREALSEMNWPGAKLTFSDDIMAKWAQAFRSLLRLQESELAQASPAGLDEAAASSWRPPALLPLKMMVQPMELRFKYHFSGDRPTNRLDKKPEFFLSHILDLLSCHRGLLELHVQPILDQRAGKASAAVSWAYTDAVSAFITALLPMLSEKLASTVPLIADHPQLMSHFMHELLRFDADIRDTWNYIPNPCTGESWKGMAWEVLVQQAWFARWLEIERNFAVSRYQEIIDSPDAGELDYDSVEQAASKPTKAAIRVNDLLETVTERYKPLVSFTQRLRFLIDIQISIFDRYHIRLREGLEAYLALTSTIGRTVQGSATSSVQGVAGLERLCRIHDSAEYLQNKMQDWSDQIFFLELLAELQRRVRANGRPDRPLAGQLTVSEVAERTSAAVSSEADVQGALFDETASAYGKLRASSLDIIQKAVIEDVLSSLKPYVKAATWTMAELPTLDGPAGVLTPTDELSDALRTVTAELRFLTGALALTPLMSVVRQLTKSLEAYLWDHVLMHRTFTCAGGAQFAFDVETLCNAIDSIVATRVATPAQSYALMHRLADALLLLCLPTDLPTEEQPDASRCLSFHEVERRIFASNESARTVMKLVGLQYLSEAEARHVLERRWEMQS